MCKKVIFLFFEPNTTREFTKQHDILMVNKMQGQFEKVKPHSQLAVRVQWVLPFVADPSVKNRI